MANSFTVKYGNLPPGNGDLLPYELGVDMNTGKIYIGKSDNTILSLSSASAIGAIAKTGDTMAGGHFVYYNASAVSSISQFYTSSPFEIREAGNVGNTQSSDIYSPSIGFRWQNVIGAAIVMPVDGKFYRINSSGNKYRLYDAQDVIPLTGGGTGAIDAAGARTNLGITPENINSINKNGDTMTGRLILPKGTHVHKTSGTSGTAGYFHLCQIVIGMTYSNAPIEIDIIQRGTNTSSRIYIRFHNDSSLDPALDYFYYTGNTAGIYLQKAATGTWDLYVTKNETYDRLSVIDFRLPDYMYTSANTFTWQSTQVSTLPEGYVQASRVVTTIADGGTGATTAAGIRNAIGLGNTTGAVPIANGGTGATTAATAIQNLEYATHMVIYSATEPTVVAGKIWLKPLA